MAISNQTSDLSDIDVWNNEVANSLLAINIVLIVYIILGVFGNLSVIYVYGVRLKIRLDDRFFILVLGVLDAIVCFLNPSFSLWRNIMPVNSNIDVACRCFWFMTRTASTASGLLILVIAVQRYLKVCRPFGPQMTTKWKKVSLIATIALSVFMHIPLIIFYGTVTLNNKNLNITGYRCGLRHDVNDTMDTLERVYFYFMLVSACVVMAGIIVLYTLTGRKIIRQIKRNQARRKSQYISNPQSETFQYSNTSADPVDSVVMNVSMVTTGSELKTAVQPSSPKKERNLLEKHRYSLMFMLIAAVSVVTYIPSLILNLSINVDSDEFWTDYTGVQRALSLFVFQMYILNHVANPFIYGFCDSTYRKEIASSCLKCVSKKQ